MPGAAACCKGVERMPGVDLLASVGCRHMRPLHLGLRLMVATTVTLGLLTTVAGWLLTDWMWSPQGDRLLIIRHSDTGERDPEGLPVLGPALLLEWSWPGGSVRNLGPLDRAYSAAYAADGRTVFVVGQSEGGASAVRILGEHGYRTTVTGLSSVTALEQVFTPRVGDGILFLARDGRGTPSGLRLLLPDGRVLDTGVPGGLLQVLEGPGWVALTAPHGFETSLHVFVEDSSRQRPPVGETSFGSQREPCLHDPGGG